MLVRLLQILWSPVRFPTNATRIGCSYQWLARTLLACHVTTVVKERVAIQYFLCSTLVFILTLTTQWGGPPVLGRFAQWWLRETRYHVQNIALNFCLSTYSLVVKCLSGCSKSCGHRFDSRPMRHRLDVHTNGWKEPCWHVMWQPL